MWVDVTDVVEFFTRKESPSGVQRVVLGVLPALMESGARLMVLDSSRGLFVELVDQEKAFFADASEIPDNETSRVERSTTALSILERAHNGREVIFTMEDVGLFLGATWINDALMLAIRDAHSRGLRCVFLLYDLTPVREAGHTKTMTRLFEKYLSLLVEVASSVPAISQATRSDFEEWCAERKTKAPSGHATGLPRGLNPAEFALTPEPWPRPYVLMVGTIEPRKNHLAALQAWQELIERHGTDLVPDLVCVGRLGWHSDAFLDEYRRTNGLNGKISVLSGGVGDRKLGAFYRHAAFTIYPSSHEGWGLPVSESLAFGKVVIAAKNSSIPEAGGSLATYIPTGSAEELRDAVETLLLDPASLHAQEDRIRSSYSDSLTWHDVAHVLMRDVRDAAEGEIRAVTFPTVDLGKEYSFATVGEPPSPDYADQYADHVMFEATTPMLSQDAQGPIPEGLLLGHLGSPQTWGYELRAGRRFDFRITRPVAGELVALLLTRSQPGVVKVEASGPGGVVYKELHLGSVLTLPLGNGAAGEGALTSLRVIDASDTVEGFMGVRSVVILERDDAAMQILAYKSAAEALRQELDFLQGTRSWRLTAPLRRWKGRGA